jgi:hypothetical protein
MKCLSLQSFVLKLEKFNFTLFGTKKTAPVVSQLLPESALDPFDLSYLSEILSEKISYVWGELNFKLFGTENLNTQLLLPQMFFPIPNAWLRVLKTLNLFLSLFAMVAAAI